MPHFYTNKSNQYVCNCGSIQNFPNRWDNFLKKIYICPNNMLKLLRKSYFMQQDHRCMSYWSKCYQYYKIILSSCILLYTWHSHVMKLFRTFNIHSTDMHDIHHSKYYHQEMWNVNTRLFNQKKKFLKIKDFMKDFKLNLLWNSRKKNIFSSNECLFYKFI